MHEGQALPVDQFITVNGVNLQYRDWGGAGPFLLLLTGMGDAAPIYDDLAPRFTDRYRVVGLTRRGHGRSDKPDAGYDMGTLVEDIRQFLDALHIERATLVGHSLAGDELTRFVSLYPARVVALVYLDAALDRTGLREVLASMPIAFPQFTEDDKASWEVTEAWAKRWLGGLWSEALAHNLRDITYVTADGMIGMRMPDQIEAALLESMINAAPDFTRIVVPALSFYALGARHFPLPPGSDAAARQRLEDWLQAMWFPYVRAQIARFRQEAPLGRVVELAEGHHYCFIDQAELVIKEMRGFLLAGSTDRS